MNIQCIAKFFETNSTTGCLGNYDLSISFCSFIGCRSASFSGGGLFYATDGTCGNGVVEDCIFQKCTSSGNGGGALLQCHTIRMNRNCFSDCCSELTSHAFCTNTTISSIDMTYTSKCAPEPIDCGSFFIIGHEQTLSNGNITDSISSSLGLMTVTSNSEETLMNFHHIVNCTGNPLIFDILGFCTFSQLVILHNKCLEDEGVILKSDNNCVFSDSFVINNTHTVICSVYVDRKAVFFSNDMSDVASEYLVTHRIEDFECVGNKEVEESHNINIEVVISVSISCGVAAVAILGVLWYLNRRKIAGVFIKCCPQSSLGEDNVSDGFVSRSLLDPNQDPPSN